MAKIRRKQNRIAEGLKVGFQRALNFGSRRRNEVAESLNNELKEEQEMREEFEIFESDLEPSQLRPVPPVGEFTGPKLEDSPSDSFVPVPPVPPVPPVNVPDEKAVDTVESEGMKAFARSVHQLGRDNEVRTMYLTMINNYTKSLSEGTDLPNIEEIKQKLAERQSELESFDKEIEIIEIEEKIHQEEESMNRLFTEISALYDDLVNELEKENYSEASKIVATLNSKIMGNVVTPTGYRVGTYGAHDQNLYNLKTKYLNIVGRSYEHDNLKYMEEDFVERIYREIATSMVKIRSISASLDESEANLIVEYEQLFDSLGTSLADLPHFLKELSKFKSKQQELDKIFTEERKKEEQTPNNDAHLEAVRIGYEITLGKKMSEIKEKLRNLSIEFSSYDDELGLLLREYEDLKNGEKELSDEVKEEIENNLQKQCDEELRGEFGTEVYEFIHDYAEDLQVVLTQLSSKSYDSPIFEERYSSLMDLIGRMKADGEKCGIKVSFDEQSQRLEIDFPVAIMKRFEQQVVMDEVVKAMADKKGEPTGPSSSNAEEEQQREKFKEEVSLLAAKYVELIENQIRELRYSDFDSIDEELWKLFHDERFNLLSSQEKNEIIGEIKTSYDNGLSDKYGREFIKFVMNYLVERVSNTGISELREMDPKDENLVSTFEATVNNIKVLIEDLKNDPKTGEFIKNIDFDLDKQMLVITYNNEAIEQYSIKIISDEAMKEIEESKKSNEPLPQPPKSPVQQEPSESTPEPKLADSEDEPELDNEEKAVQAYLEKVEEVNYIVSLLNEINAVLESQAIMNFVNPLEAKRAIELEQEAKSLDQKLIDLKIELSKERLGFKQKYNKFILSIPEVKEAKIHDVKFSGNLNDFIGQHDLMIVEAENRIFELAELRRENPDNLDAINLEIQNLMSFIDSQNSLVGRRLVSEAKNSSIDIVSLLQERRENKKEIRERLRQVQENNIVNNEGLNPAEKKGDYVTLFDELKKALEEDFNKKVFNLRTNFNSSLTRYMLSAEILDMVNELKKYYEPDYIDSIVNDYESKYDRVVVVEKPDYLDRLYSDIDRLKFSITENDVLEDSFDAKLATILGNITNLYKCFEGLRLVFDPNRNEIVINYVAEVCSLTNDEINKIPVEYKVYDFLVPEIYSAYVNKKKDNTEISLDCLRNVGMYFVENYSNGKVVFQAVAKNYLMKTYGYTIEEVEKAIESLSEKGIIENRNGVLLALVNIQEFENKINNSVEADLSQSEKMPEPEVSGPTEEKKTDAPDVEPTVNIVQRGLTFNPRDKQQIATKAKNIITTGDAVTVSLIKNGIKIKYSQDLREKLSQLNAKLSLVNKENYRSRTSSTIDAEAEEQTVAFKDDREIRPEDYKIEIRVPNAGDSDVLYEFDLEDVSEELKSRSK